MAASPKFQFHEAGLSVERSEKSVGFPRQTVVILKLGTGKGFTITGSKIVSGHPKEDVTASATVNVPAEVKM